MIVVYLLLFISNIGMGQMRSKICLYVKHRRDVFLHNSCLWSNELFWPSFCEYKYLLRSNPNLVGFISPQLFTHFPSLQILTLSQSRISGVIPPKISELKSLVHLDLSYNQLTGFIPVQLCKLGNLMGLDLSYNSLTGSVPNTIGQLGIL
ncbi:hypothetical protein L6452_05730 [Arctium lappa]|uniref:Uncharacterized protein n=1 Tax=Arctium lappa TaxID=4217 RepID=A0ACB9EH90_ARCLA|nr:hypothetical protein L6452_05730 [Arctium lappa]